MSRQTQHAKIVRYLQTRKGGITSAEAVAKLGILNLTTRISEMRQMGYEFAKVRETSPDGEYNYNRYFLIKTK